MIGHCSHSHIRREVTSVEDCLSGHAQDDCQGYGASAKIAASLIAIGTGVFVNIEARIAELGLELPESPSPIANYVRYVQVGNLLYLSGTGPTRDGKPAYVGQVPTEVSVEDAYDAARIAALNLLGSAKEALGDLDRIKRVVKVLGMVNSAPGFGDQPKVINGFSDLMVEIFGDAGRHARSAVGMAGLPNNIPVEIEMIVEVE